MLRIVIIVMTLLMLVMGVSAQDGTPPPTNTRIAAATVEAVAVVDAPAVERVTLNLGQLVAAMIGGFVTGGFTVGGALVVLFERVKRDPALTLAIEGLINSVPVQYKQGANVIAKTVGDVSKVVEELTDDKPGINIPATISPE